MSNAMDKAIGNARFGVIALSLTAALLVGAGCSSGKKDENAPTAANPEAAKSRAQTSFESGEDPPITADTHFAAGQLAESQKVMDRALQQYKLALKRNPKHTGALFRLGALQTELKQFPDAVANWKRYIKVTNAAEGYSNLGYCYELWGKRADAENAYMRGIERDPHNQPCRVNYGLMLARQGRTKEAMAQLESVLSPAEVYYNLGSAHEQMGRRDDARAAYEKAIQIDPSMQEARERLTALK